MILPFHWNVVLKDRLLLFFKCLLENVFLSTNIFSKLKRKLQASTWEYVSVNLLTSYRTYYHTYFISNKTHARCRCCCNFYVKELKAPRASSLEVLNIVLYIRSPSKKRGRSTWLNARTDRTTSLCLARINVSEPHQVWWVLTNHEGR